MNLVLVWIVLQNFVDCIQFVQLRKLAKLSVLIGGLQLTMPYSTYAADGGVDRGKMLFQMQCAGCHVGGGNILNGGKNLRKETLQKNGYFEAARMLALIDKGRGQMPAYGEYTSQCGDVIPAQLSVTDMGNVVEYIKQQAELKWPAATTNDVLDTRNCDEYPGC